MFKDEFEFDKFEKKLINFLNSIRAFWKEEIYKVGDKDTDITIFNSKRQKEKKTESAKIMVNHKAHNGKECLRGDLRK